MTAIDHQIERIKQFWEDQAATHGSDLAATNPDVYAKELELKALADALDPKLDTLEVGCGNGFNLFRLAEILTGRLVGFDYSENMITAAQHANERHPQRHRLSFSIGDVLGDLSAYSGAQQIFTDRGLINLPTLDLQLSALANLAEILEPGGRLVLARIIHGTA